jgi:segregation and condensation protein B
MEQQKLKNILEAILMSAGKPLSADKLVKMFDEDARPSITDVKKQLQALVQDCEGRGIELVEVASGYRYQGRKEYGPWVAKLWEVKPQRYSRALLETLALIAYRQPVTRADIEEVRGVSVSSNIMKTLMEREWVQVVGHRDAPGRPAMYATTRQFLDYFNLKSLDQLPTLSEIKDLSKLEPELDLDNTMSQVEEGTQPQADELSSDGPVEEQSDVIPENESVH